MKIIAVSGNHESGASAGTVSMRLLPDSALLHTDAPFFLPTHVAPNWAVVPAVAVRIGRLGKCIAPRFASRYRTDVMACLVAKPVNTGSLDAADVRLSGCDGSVMLGDPVPGVGPSQALVEVRLSTDSSPAATLSAATMALSFDHLLSLASQGMTLKNGDLLLDLSPKPLPVTPGCNLWATLCHQPSLEIRVK